MPFQFDYGGLDPQAWNQYGSQSGGQWDKGMSDLQLFGQSYYNMTGKNPTSDDYNNFLKQGLMGAPNSSLGNYSDMSNLANNYVQNTYSPQIADYQKQQQQTQLGQTQQTIQDLVNKQTQSTTADLTNPTGPTYGQFSGMMNNMGITPSSGVFQAGLGGVIGQNAANAENQALGQVSLPAISGMQNTANYPFQIAGNNSDMSHINSEQDFGLQAQLAQILAKEGQPSGTQNMFGMATGAAGGAGSLLQGGSSAYNATSYVCKELIKRDLICQEDMDDFHVHIMPAMFKKGRAFWKYAVDGWRLVEAVNKKGLDWKVFKPLLFDRVMEEPDPCKAVDLYADACHQLCISSDRSLWDERVFRTSVTDSLIFLPRLLTYAPFIKALAKCFRIKTMFLYDKPRCEVHR